MYNKQALLLTLEEYSTVKLILSMCIVIRFDFFYYFDIFLFNYDFGINHERNVYSELFIGSGDPARNLIVTSY